MMSLTNPPSAASGGGPGSVSAVRTQGSKRGVDAFKGILIMIPDMVKKRDKKHVHWWEDVPQVEFKDRHSNNGMVYKSKERITQKYKIIGFISSGTYGRVYKASDPTGRTSDQFAIKKFKPDKEGEQIQYTGISQSAVREMALCTELHHDNIIKLVEIMLEDKCIFMVFEYAEHDLLQIIHHHTQQPRHPIPPATVKSIMFQLLNGCQYLHTNWVLHRDLKPANIMVTSSGRVKIGDLGLARLCRKPLNSLFNGDKVVVTIWYRAPELLLGSRQYNPAVDMWAVGCIFAELLSLRPIFKGEEAKMDKKSVPFQRNQMQKIVDIMGLPTKDRWPLLSSMPEYQNLSTLTANTYGGGGYGSSHHHQHHPYHHQHHRPSPSSAIGAGVGAAAAAASTSHLEKWYYNIISSSAPSSTSSQQQPLSSLGAEGYRLLSHLLEYDPEKRLTAAKALEHPFFGAAPAPSATGATTSSPAASMISSAASGGGGVNEVKFSASNCFDQGGTGAGSNTAAKYPNRRVSQEDNDMRSSGMAAHGAGSLPSAGTKRSGLHHQQSDDSMRAVKRIKEN